jgi:electron transfer flavoprotein beta subunit
MKAKSAKITVLTQKELGLDAQSIGLCGSPTQVVKIFTPPQRSGGQILTGEIPEIVTKLVEEIKDQVN